MIASLGGDVKLLALSPSGEVGPEVIAIIYLTCAVIGLGGQGVIKTWTKVAARVRLYMLTSDLTSLVPPQFSHWLQVRKVGTAYYYFYYWIIINLLLLLMPLFFCSKGSSPALISDVALEVASKLTTAVLSKITAAR